MGEGNVLVQPMSWPIKRIWVVAYILFSVIHIAWLQIQLRQPAYLKRARAELESIDVALAQYRQEQGYYPSDSRGLQALLTTQTRQGNSVYLNKIPIDPWGNVYHYRAHGHHNTVDVFSYGISSRPGYALIANWQPVSIQQRAHKANGHRRDSDHSTS